MPSVLATVIEQQGPALYRIAWRILRQAEEVDDVLQDVALQAIKISQSETEVKNWLALLKRITVCRSLDRLRLRKRRPTDVFQESDFSQTATSVVDSVIGRELETRLCEAIAILPDRQAEVFSLRYFDDCSNTEIASSLDISTAAVATALKKARERLRCLLSDSSTSNSIQKGGCHE